ncbi:hypothetical protein B0H16DRAFT_1451220 [Mycena metata]|uniref:Uncharacterized protein n=1 Tax=Mycena metata TaxID=1033252 RepID=A0AAD7JWR6_9AGAR|nr:hypothetical protein B0H16DRAFT_1451220 [Mycena metata]
MLWRCRESDLNRGTFLRKQRNKITTLERHANFLLLFSTLGNFLGVVLNSCHSPECQGIRTKRHAKGAPCTSASRAVKRRTPPGPEPPFFPPPPYPAHLIPPLQLPPSFIEPIYTPYKGIFSEDPGVSLEDLLDSAPTLPWRCIAFLHCTHLISRTLVAQRLFPNSPTLADLLTAFGELRSIIAHSGVAPAEFSPAIHAWASDAHLEAPPSLIFDRRQGEEEARFVSCIFVAALKLRMLLVTVVDPACYEVVKKLLHYADSVLTFTYAFVFPTD